MVTFFRLNRRIDKDLFIRFSSFIEKHKSKCIVILFDTSGGEAEYAIKMIKSMKTYPETMFVAIPIGKVHSAAIPLYLSCEKWFPHREKASALIHRSSSQFTDRPVSKQVLKKVDRAVFKVIAERLGISLRNVYQMADKNTVIDYQHPLGKRFFLNLKSP